MRDDHGSSKIGAGTLAVIGLATCCGVKLALLVSAGVLTAGAVGRSVAVLGVGVLVLVATLLVVARRRATADASCPRRSDPRTEPADFLSQSSTVLDQETNGQVEDPITKSW